MTRGPSHSGFRAVLAHRNFQKLYAAGITSSSGAAVTGVSILWIVFASTRSPIDVGLVGATQLAGGLVFSLVGGGLVDRHDRRNLMISADVVRAATIAGLALWLTFLGFELSVILVAAFVVQSFSSIFGPAEGTVIPAVVGPELIADANGLIRSSQAASMLAGASVGGVLIVTVGPVVGLGYNAATFLVSAALLSSLHLSAQARRPTRSSRPTSFLADVLQGFRWLRGEVGLLQLTVSAGFFNFFESMVLVFLVVYATLALHGSGAVFGLLLACQLGAQGAGALAVGRTGSTRWAGRVWVVFAGVLAPLAAIGLALVPNFYAAMGLLAFLGFVSAFAGTTWLSAVQVMVPTEMQGRYFGVDSLGSWAILPVAQIGGGFLIAAIGVTTTYLIAGVLWLLIGVAFLFLPALAAWGVPPGRAVALPPAGAPGHP
jgi:hypothetical protein